MKIKHARKQKRTNLVIFSLALILIISFLLPYTNPNASFIMMLSKFNIIYLPSTAVEKCCDRMRHLNLILNKAERSLRSSLRFRNTVLLPQKFIKESPMQYIYGCKASQGSDTTEWGASVTLLGVLRLWRVTLPPDTILAVKPPTPSDCWPFRGSYGEVIIELPKRTQVGTVSVEHIRPDTTRSAPKHFTIFGILDNGTWIKGADALYTYNKPSKQYFLLNTRNLLLKQVVFRVLSNQGNTKYTCIYRVHLYTNNLNI